MRQLYYGPGYKREREHGRMMMDGDGLFKNESRRASFVGALICLIGRVRQFYIYDRIPEGVCFEKNSTRAGA